MRSEERRGFATTRWSLVLAAGAKPSREARRALEELCQQYWHPLYAFVRHLGHGPDEAQDLTQAFLVDFLEREALQAADPARGRFRSFLRGCLKHFLSHERDRALTKKRGGDRLRFSLHGEEGETRYLPVSHEPDPARVFDRVWMNTVLQRVFERLEDAIPSADRGYQRRLFTGLYDPKLVEYAAVAREFGKAETAVRQAVSRLRKKYREILLEEIGQTVSDARVVEDEIRELFRIAAG